MALSRATSGSLLDAAAVLRLVVAVARADFFCSVLDAVATCVSRADVDACVLVFAGLAAAWWATAGAVGDAAIDGVLAAAAAFDAAVTAGAAGSAVATIVAALGGSITALAATALDGALILVMRSVLSSARDRWLHHDQLAPHTTSNSSAATSQPIPRRFATPVVGRVPDSSASSMRIEASSPCVVPRDEGMVSIKLGLPEAGCAIEEVGCFEFWSASIGGF